MAPDPNPYHFCSRSCQFCQVQHHESRPASAPLLPLRSDEQLLVEKFRAFSPHGQRLVWRFFAYLDGTLVAAMNASPQDGRPSQSPKLYDALRRSEP